MRRLYPQLAHWLSAPLWLWLLAPSAAILLAALIGGGVWMSAERQHLRQLKQQYRDGENAIEQWRRKITPLPDLHSLQRWLAGQPLSAQDWPLNRISSLLDAPLHDSGVHLEVWQPLSAQARHGSSPAWRLVFKAEYGETLDFLSRFSRLPVVLRIDRITIRKVPAGLRTELQLSLPQPSKAKP
ncbi:hypothetical protein [Dickeya chrysanthemi]|uniref:hypothetical protein n=1 Tax=Dickeya chrysanthemi TaxID=556 RepID=UPI00039E70D8|nr:hypothetical protein [Dickeya chrysanthemi]